MDLTRATWRTSSYSGNNGGACVQIAQASVNVAVRDSKNASGGVLIFPSGTWKAFIGRTKHAADPS
jgi:Domain of unknown function (DUF397)